MTVRGWGGAAELLISPVMLSCPRNNAEEFPVRSHYWLKTSRHVGTETTADSQDGRSQSLFLVQPLRLPQLEDLAVVERVDLVLEELQGRGLAGQGPGDLLPHHLHHLHSPDLGESVRPAAQGSWGLILQTEQQPRLLRQTDRQELTLKCNKSLNLKSIVPYAALEQPNLSLTYKRSSHSDIDRQQSVSISAVLSRWPGLNPTLAR